MRAAPNPNGPWHVGHARMPAVIGTYKERYDDGKFICRFDDTDPETKRPDMDAYDAILEDIAYLGFEADRVLKASDRLETYYDHARDLIDAGGAYTCSCSGDDFSALKNDAEACPTATKTPRRFTRSSRRWSTASIPPARWSSACGPTSSTRIPRSATGLRSG